MRYRTELPPDFDRPTVEAASARLDRCCRSAQFLMRFCFWVAPVAFFGSFFCIASPATQFLTHPLMNSAPTLFVLSIVFWIAEGSLNSKRGVYSLQLSEDATRKRELEHGLRAPANYDTPVAQTEWTPEMTQGADWAFGTVQQLLPTDTVVRFGWQAGPLFGRGGFAVQRGDRIVAELITWVS